MPGSGRSPGAGNGNPLPYSCLENPMDRGAWLATSTGSQRVGHDWATSLTSLYNDAKAKTPVLWPPHAKSWLIGKDSDAGRDWGQEEKGTTDDEMAGWHHQLNGRESEWTLGDGWWTGRPGVLQFMGPQRVGHDWATELNWTELNDYPTKQLILLEVILFLKLSINDYITTMYLVRGQVFPS